MARILSRSIRQLYSSRYILQPRHVVPVRFYAKETSSKAYNEMMKGIYSGVMDKLDIAIGVLQRKMNRFVRVITPVEGLGYFDSLRFNFITISVFRKNYDPSEPGFETMLMNEAEEFCKKIKKIAGEEIDKEYVYRCMRVIFTVKWQTKGIHDIRTLFFIVIDTTVEDSARPAVKAMIISGIDKVEAEIKKPLMLNNRKGNALLIEELRKIALKKTSPRFGLEILKKDAREVIKLVY